MVRDQGSIRGFLSASTQAVFALFFAVLCGTVIYAQADAEQKVDRIRKIYAETSAKIENVEKGTEEDRLAGIAVNEMVVNSTGKSWPAVGNYKVVYRFYYDSAGENPYPSRLLRITVSTESAARRYVEEFGYDYSGNLNFYFERSEDDDSPLERRVYFDSGKAFRFTDDGKTRDKLTEADGIIANKILATENKLRGIFEATLD